MKNPPSKPLYYQLKQNILKWIEDEKYMPGDLLPSEKQLQEEFNLSRTTVRLAMKELELEGVVVRSPGKGTFVACLKTETGPRRLLSFTKEMQKCNLTPSSEILSFEKELPPAKIAKGLEISEDQTVWRMERIRLADGVPMATEINYIPSTLLPGLEAINKSLSFYQYIEQAHNIVAAYANERVEARIANFRESKQLGIAKGAPVLYVERLTYGYVRNRPMVHIPIEMVKIVYNAEKYAVNLHIER